jgi:hypothetical protein
MNTHIYLGKVPLFPWLCLVMLSLKARTQQPRDKQERQMWCES